LGKARNGTGNSPNCRRLIRIFELGPIILRHRLSAEPVRHEAQNLQQAAQRLLELKIEELGLSYLGRDPASGNFSASEIIIVVLIIVSVFIVAYF
jgi:hypothetical protein